jgi:hypothetical protein
MRFIPDVSPEVVGLPDDMTMGEQPGWLRLPVETGRQPGRQRAI